MSTMYIINRKCPKTYSLPFLRISYDCTENFYRDQTLHHLLHSDLMHSWEGSVNLAILLFFICRAQTYSYS